MDINDMKNLVHDQIVAENPETASVITALLDRALGDGAYSAVKYKDAKRMVFHIWVTPEEQKVIRDLLNTILVDETELNEWYKELLDS